MMPLKVVSAATPASAPQDTPTSSSQSTTRLPTKIILPKKKPMKYTTGFGPGEYGGPPVTSKPRKFWADPKDDPITSDDLIWNRDFMSELETLVSDVKATDEELLPPSIVPVEDESSGFLSLNRVMSLDNLEVDLSASLTVTANPTLEQPTAAAQTMVNPIRRWRPAPTNKELEKWGRAAKAATGGTDVMLRGTRRPKVDPEVLAAQSREQYYKLKSKLLLLTAGIGGVGLVSAYVSYSPEVAASFGAGLLGSLVYLRMLGNSIDSMASTGTKKLIKRASGQPRLLVPVVLVMMFNRWNEILVPQYGVMHLELIPMLVGFFTYKIATFAQAIEDVLPSVGKKSEL